MHLKSKNKILSFDFNYVPHYVNAQMYILSSQLEFSSMAMAKQKEECRFSFVLSLVVVVLFLCNNGWFAIARADQTGYISAVGDPGMKRDSLRVAIESWNQCNEVGEEVPHMGSPRAADCFDIYQASSTQSNGKVHIQQQQQITNFMNQ